MTPDKMTPKEAAALMESFACTLHGFRNPHGAHRLPELKEIATQIFVLLCGEQPDEHQLRSAIAL